MKLYLVERTDDVDWCEYRSFVVAAESESSAKEFNPDIGRKIEEDDNDYKFEDEWTAKENLTVQYIGESNSLVEKVIHTSYNNG